MFRVAPTAQIYGFYEQSTCLKQFFPGVLLKRHNPTLLYHIWSICCAAAAAAAALYD
jgi:hypothetical protein